MSLVVTRSPFFVSRFNYLGSAFLRLEIGSWDYGDAGWLVDKTYELDFRNSKYLDISPFIRDYIDAYVYTGNNLYSIVKYIRTTLSGTDSNGNAVADTVAEHYVSDGYLFSTDGYNEDLNDTLKENCWFANSTDMVYKLDDSNLRLTFFQPNLSPLSGGRGAGSPDTVYEGVNLVFYNRGEVVDEVDLSGFFDDGESSGALYQYLTERDASYKSRVERGFGVLEDSICLKNFFDEFSTVVFDKIVMTNDSGYSKTVEVKTIEECKHKPYRVTFTNRYGMPEDLWFFKRSKEEISINRESYRSNSLDSYTANEGVRNMINYNVNGFEKIMLNSGFVEEEMNEAFRQLLLSENVILYDYEDNKNYNANVVTSDFSYKTHTNDKLINYEIEFEFAHEVINNVG